MIAISAIVSIGRSPSTGNATYLGIVAPIFSQAWMSAEPAMEMCEQQWRNQVFKVVGTFDRHFLAICSDRNS